MKNKLDKTLNNFLGSTHRPVRKNTSNEVCDLKTGECYTIKPKDGIIERINKTFITEDGRQLLED